MPPPPRSDKPAASSRQDGTKSSVDTPSRTCGDRASGLDPAQHKFPAGYKENRTIIPQVAAETPGGKRPTRQVAALEREVTTLRAQLQSLTQDLTLAHEEACSAQGTLSTLKHDLERYAARQAALLDILPANVALLNRAGNIVAVNEEWRRFARNNDFSGANLGVGMNYIEMCDKARGNAQAEARDFSRKLRRLLSGKEQEVELTYTCHSPKEQRYFRCIARAFSDGERPYGAVVLHLDETHRITVERTMRRARDLAEAANSAKSAFLANMSHELRTPLNAIIGFSEIQKAELFGPQGHEKYREYAGDIYAEGQKLLGMIDQILDLSKVETSNQKLNETIVEVSACKDRAFQLVQPLARGKGISLTARIPEDLPSLLADEAMLRQMIVNLLSNAIKFTRKNGSIRFDAELRNDGWMRFGLSDSGVGLSAQDVPPVLDPFSPSGSPVPSDLTNFGLGLPFVKSLVQLHGGRLELDSEANLGTTVRLFFPPERIVQVGSKARAGAATEEQVGE